MDNAPVRACKEALRRSWIDPGFRRDGKRTHHNSFFATLPLTADKVVAIAPAG